MPTIIWCDRAPHVVQESRSEVHRTLAQITRRTAKPTSFQQVRVQGHDNFLPDFAYFTRHTDKTCTCQPPSACSDCPPAEGKQFALRVSAITSFEARGNDGA